MTANDANEIAANCLSKFLVRVIILRNGSKGLLSKANQNTRMQGAR